VLKQEPPREDGGTATAGIMRVWETQVEYLKESMALFAATDNGRTLRDWDGLQRLKRQVEDTWLEHNQLRPLDDTRKLRVSSVPLPHT
jgi:hypothetical protein